MLNVDVVTELLQSPYIVYKKAKKGVTVVVEVASFVGNPVHNHRCIKYRHKYFSTRGCKPDLMSIIVCCCRACNAFITFHTIVETSI